MTEHRELGNRLSPYQTNTQKEDELDLLQILIDIKDGWRQFLLIFFSFVIISFVIVLKTPDVYLVYAEIGLPDQANTEKYRHESLVPRDKYQIFDYYVNTIKSLDNFRHFVKDQNVVQRYFNSSDDNNDLLILGLFQSIDFQYKESVPIDENKNFPVLVISMRSSDSIMASQILNEYLLDTNSKLLADITKQSLLIKNQRLKEIEDQLVLLDRHGLERLSYDILEREKSLKLEIDTLLLAIRSLEALSEEKRVSSIQEVDDAIKIAEQIGLSDLSPKEMMSNLNGAILRNKQEQEGLALPLYLMGKNFLIAYKESVKNQRNGYDEEISKIKQEIEAKKNDPLLIRMKSELGTGVKSEEQLKLKAQKSVVSSKGIDLKGLELFTITRTANSIGQNIKPRSVQILLLGSIIGAVLGIGGAIGSSVYKRRVRII